jgi:hypothetical protein
MAPRLPTRTALFLAFAALAAPAAVGQSPLDRVLPVRGLCIAAPRRPGLDAFVEFIETELAPRSVNVLVLRVDYHFQYQSHPELANGGGLNAAEADRLAEVCRKHGIELIPHINLLGHQSWGNRLNRLLAEYPQFDETPWVEMPDDHEWPNPDGLYCKSYCPRHPEVHGVVFALVDELCDAFGATSFHAGLDEVFYIGEDRCPRCGGRDKAQLFADEVTLIRNHLHERGRRMWMWGDRLLDGETTGLGEWEASTNGTHGAIDLIPKDVLLCDWHYDRPDPTAAFFALKGFDVVSCPWKNSDSALMQLADVVRHRAHSSHPASSHFRGMMQTVWSGADGFLEEMQQSDDDEESASRCFRTLFDEIAQLPTDE